LSEALVSTVTIKGQVTIPKPIREHLGIGPGSEVRFMRAADGTIILEPVVARPSASRFEKLRGHGGKGLSTDEIMALTRGEP
jgi:AbrB family looped-hinge helix DNA binding protein